MDGFAKLVAGVGLFALLCGCFMFFSHASDVPDSSEEEISFYEVEGSVSTFSEAPEATNESEESSEDIESEASPSPSIEGEITEGQFRSYVLGFLTFFTVVILFYFAYRFFRIFF